MISMLTDSIRGLLAAHRRLLTIFALFAMAAASMAAAQVTVTVDASADLRGALRQAQPGTVIVLAPGTYGEVTLNEISGLDDAPLTIRSADPEAPAVLSRLTIRDSSHIVVEDLVLDYRYAPGDRQSVTTANIAQSSDITLRRLRLDGDVAHGTGTVDDGFGFGLGMMVRNSSGVTIEGCRFAGFFRGLALNTGANHVVRNSEFTALRKDGINIQQVEGLLITNNYFHDFAAQLAARDHRDMIQVWTTNSTAPTRDLTIRNNIFNSGSGAWTQTIFMRNDQVDKGLAGHEMFYRNVLIEENVILNSHIHGIVLGASDGLVIRNNTLVQNHNSVPPPHHPPRIRVPLIKVVPDSQDVTIERNVTSDIQGYNGQTDWQVGDNYLIQGNSRLQSGYYEAVFAAPGTTDPSNLAAYRYRQDGPLAGAGIGASRLDVGQ